MKKYSVRLSGDPNNPTISLPGRNTSKERLKFKRAIIEKQDIVRKRNKDEAKLIGSVLHLMFAAEIEGGDATFPSSFFLKKPHPPFTMRCKFVNGRLQALSALLLPKNQGDRTQLRKMFSGWSPVGRLEIGIQGLMLKELAKTP